MELSSGRTTTSRTRASPLMQATPLLRKPPQAATTRNVEVPALGASESRPPTTPTADTSAKVQLIPAPFSSALTRLLFRIGGLIAAVAADPAATRAVWPLVAGSARGTPSMMIPTATEAALVESPGTSSRDDPLPWNPISHPESCGKVRMLATSARSVGSVIMGPLYLTADGVDRRTAGRGQARIGYSRPRLRLIWSRALLYSTSQVAVPSSRFLIRRRTSASSSSSTIMWRLRMSVILRRRVL